MAEELNTELSEQIQNSIDSFWKRVIRNPNVLYSPVSLKTLKNWVNLAVQLEERTNETTLNLDEIPHEYLKIMEECGWLK